MDSEITVKLCFWQNLSSIGFNFFFSGYPRFSGMIRGGGLGHQSGEGTMGLVKFHLSDIVRVSAN